MCDFTTLQKILKKIICKKINHTHIYIIVYHIHTRNMFYKKSVDNLQNLFFKKNKNKNKFLHTVSIF